MVLFYLYFQPLFWEYWWCISLPVAFVGLSAIRKNNIQSLQIYVGGTIANGIVPVLVALTYYFADVWTYVNTRSTKKIQTWQVRSLIAQITIVW